MDAKGTVLVLEVNAGLCNRIRAFVSGLCWAEKLNRRLVVCWPDEKPECAATFSNLFQALEARRRAGDERDERIFRPGTRAQTRCRPLWQKHPFA